jgi:hypothetical protein
VREEDDNDAVRGEFLHSKGYGPKKKWPARARGRKRGGPCGGGRRKRSWARKEKGVQGGGKGFVLKKKERGFSINHMRGKTKIF